MAEWPEDHVFNRWFQIKRLSADGLLKLHAAEKSAWDLSVEAGKKGDLINHRSDWRYRGIQVLEELNNELGPFWNPKSEVVWRSSELEKYKKFLFRLCRGIWDKRSASYNKSPGEKGYFPEIEAIHAVDRLIHEADKVFPPSWGENDQSARAKRTLLSHGLDRKNIMAGNAYIDD